MSKQTEAQRLADKLELTFGFLNEILPSGSTFDAEELNEAAAELRRLEAANAELLEALNHAVEIAEARRPGVWDDLLQYRAAIKKHGGAA